MGAHAPSFSSGLELDLHAARRPVRATAPSSPLGGASSAAMPSCHGAGAGPGEVREHERHRPAPRLPRPAAAPSSFLWRGPRQWRRPARRPAAVAAPSPACFSLPCRPPAAAVAARAGGGGVESGRRGGATAGAGPTPRRAVADRRPPLSPLHWACRTSSARVVFGIEVAAAARKTVNTSAIAFTVPFTGTGADSPSPQPPGGRRARRFSFNHFPPRGICRRQRVIK